MTTEQLLNSPTIIAAAALFIGLGANAIALLVNHKNGLRHKEDMKQRSLDAQAQMQAQTQAHRENLHIAITKLTNKEL